MGPERTEGVTHCNPVTPYPLEEESPPPGSIDVEVAEEVITPLQDTALSDDAIPASEPVAATVTPVTQDVSQGQAPMRPATNGQRNDTTQPQRPDPYCPGCGAMTCWLDRGHY
jgi:hypothetical protein